MVYGREVVYNKQLISIDLLIVTHDVILHLRALARAPHGGTLGLE